MACYHTQYVEVWLRLMLKPGSGRGRRACVVALRCVRCVVVVVVCCAISIIYIYMFSLKNRFVPRQDSPAAIYSKSKNKNIYEAQLYTIWQTFVEFDAKTNEFLRPNVRFPRLTTPRRKSASAPISWFLYSTATKMQKPLLVSNNFCYLKKQAIANPFSF